MFNQKEYNKKYYKENKEHYREYREKYYEENKKHLREWGKEYSKKYRQENKEKIKEYQKKYWKEYRQRNKGKLDERDKEYYQKNKEKISERFKKYSKTEKGKAKRQRSNSKRQAKYKEIINTLTHEEWLAILKKYGYKCAYCDKEFDLFNLPTRDHIIPISKGGDNIKENIIPACRSCNAKKGNKILPERREIERRKVRAIKKSF